MGKNKKALGCVMKAMKCSSRASKEENKDAQGSAPLCKDGVVESGWADFGEIGASIDRIASDDTHETPPVSNVDPYLTTSFPETKNHQNLDAVVSTYFNTPAGQPMPSIAPLGDSLSPVESLMEEEGEEDLERTQESRSKAEMFQVLEIPKMEVKTESEVSSYSLLGEELLEEKKEKDLILNPDNASMTIGLQHTKAGENSSWKSDSSFTTISSFSQLRSNTSTPLSFDTSSSDDHLQKPLTPHTFFWRTHPKKSIPSYNTTYKNNATTSLKPRIPRPPSKKSYSSISVSKRVRPKYVSSDEVTSDSGSGGGGGGRNCAPFLRPEVVRKFLGEQQFQLQISNFNSTTAPSPTTTTTSHTQKLVQSLTSRLPSWGQTEEATPTEMNFTMG
jgi:hypothetical protein